MATVTMLVNDKVIETKMFPTRHLQIEGYMQGLQLDMLERNEDLLANETHKPEFRLEIPKRKLIYN